VSRTERLWVVLIANLALVGALIGVGIAAHSLGVWAEGADYLADAAAVGVSIFAIHLAQRPPTPRRQHGYPRATRYAALVNAGWLLVLSVLIAASAIDRFAGGVRRVHGLPVLIVSAIAAAVMLGGALLLGGGIDDEEEEGQDLSLRAVLLDTIADAAAAAGVAAAGAVIYASHGLFWLDPAVALTIALVVGYHATRLLLQIRTALTR
jgi:cobalt-zinc-cadmium efflux system protein